MTAPLNEKGLEAVEQVICTTHFTNRMSEAKKVLSAYLSAVALPDELGVVAWDRLRELIGEYFDLGYAEGVVQRDADTMAGDAQLTLSEIETIISQANSTLAALRAERDEALETVKMLQGAQAAVAARYIAAEAEVKRLTEDNEALRAALREDQEPALEHIETLTELLKVIKEHWIDYDHVFSIAVHEADDFFARHKTLNSREKAE